MNILPTLTEIRKIVSDGKYRKVPVSCELLSDFTTPIEVMKILETLTLLSAGISTGKREMGTVYISWF